ncbi:MAG: RNA methyltransferase [Tannerella sp.]|jgi:TrmH family RNA methyltransferase|nr:RNA methyltransferase [Tannerella sp.]
MLSKAKIKDIKSLEIKKFRDAAGLFVAEGNKLVADMLPAFECEYLIARTRWIATQGDINAREIILADNESDIRKVSFMQTPQDVVAVFRKPLWSVADASPDDGLVLCLDGIQNPGNLGAIVRIADWFGLRHIVCSPDTADVFGVKAVQATMGALANVQVHYTSLSSYLADCRSFPIYGAFLNDADSIYSRSLTSSGVIVMGNEGVGIRPDVETLISDRLYIPPFPADNPTTDSLNVAVATAIICSEFRGGRIRHCELKIKK